jgi:1,4-dihydroxy-2-naphthoate octaprenyltransferase
LQHQENGKSSITKWSRAVRIRLLSASIVSVTCGLVIAWAEFGVFNAWYACLTYVGVVCAHASIDLLNDYFDYKNKIDVITVRTPLSGGTGVLPEGVLQPSSVYRAGVFLLVSWTLVGVVLTALRGWIVGVLVLFGVLSVYFYSTKIVNIGLGEGLLVLKGTFIVLGTFYVQSLTLTAAPFMVGVVMGLLSSAALYVNEFPDFEADRKCGRRNLVVRMGVKEAARVYALTQRLCSG